MAVSAEREAGSPPLRILIVEDHPDGRATLRALLEMLGHRVTVAEDGEEGVAKALAEQPDVAVVDIGLPRVDGYEVAARLRRAFGRGIFLIAHTGYGQPEDRARAVAAGYDAHLIKPYDWSELDHLLAFAVETIRG